MAQQPESRLKRRMDDAFLQLFGGRHDPRSYHTSIEGGRGQRAGLPDRFYAALGRHAWVESKVAGGALSRLQEVTCARMARAGCRVVVVWGTRDADLLRLVEYMTNGDTFESEARISEFKQLAFWQRLLARSAPVRPPSR